MMLQLVAALVLSAAPVMASGGCAWVSNPTSESCPQDCTFVASMTLCYDPSCPQRTNESSCAARSGCTWSHAACIDYTLAYGTLACANSTTPETCAGTHCFLARNGSCLTGSSSSACAWLTPKDENSCPLRCDYNTGTGLCFEPRCFNFTTRQQCSQDLGCSWTNDKCLDYNVAYANYSCTAAPDESQCGGNCQWSSSQQRCISGSASQACAWLSQGSAQDCPDRCTFNSALGICYDPQCSARNSSLCAQTSGCTWVYDECRDYNVAYGNYQCRLATSRDVCGGRCQWNNRTSTCIAGSQDTACAWLPQGDEDMCPTHCTFSEATGLCYQPLCTSYGQDDCNHDKGCTYSNGRCLDYNVAYGSYKCSGITDESECASSCQWSNGRCLRGSSSSPCAWLDQTADTCPTPRCTWNSATSLCYDPTCASLSTEACTGRGGCTIRDGQCQDYNVAYGSYNCSGASTIGECGGRCQWNNNTQKCIFGSSDQACAWLTQGSAEDCPSRCTYDANLGLCYEPQCSAFTQATCSNALGCSFEGGKCLDYNLQYNIVNCSAARTPSVCGGRCYWSVSSASCETRLWVANGCTTEDVESQIAAVATACRTQFTAFDQTNALTVFDTNHTIDVCYGTCGAALRAANCTIYPAQYSDICTGNDTCGIEAVASLKLLQCEDLESADPSVSNKVACDAAAQCRYEADSNRCVPHPSAELLAKVCQPCVRDYLDLGRSAQVAAGGAVDTTLLDRYDRYCSRIPGQFCHALDIAQVEVGGLMSLLNALTPTELSTVCSSVSTRQCFRKVVSSEVQGYLDAAHTQFTDCLAVAGNVTAAQSACQKTLNDANQMTYSINAYLAQMCAQKPDGTLCLSLPQTLTDSQKGCFRAIVSGVACTDACNTTLENVFADWGCCAATLQSVFGAVPSDSSRLIDAVATGDINAAPVLPSSATSLDGFMWFLETCGSLAQHVPNWLGASTCAPVNNGTGTNFSINVPIPYTAVSDSNATADDLKAAVVTDLGVQLGVSTSAFTTVSLTEDTAVMVETTAGGSSAEARRTTTTTSSISVRFSLNTGNAQDDAAVSSDFSYQRSLGVLALSSTNNVLQQSCGSCSATGVLAGVQNLGPVTEPPILEPPPPTTSSTALVSTLVAVLVTILLAL